MLRVDDHLHVGVVWGGRNEPTPASASGAAAYLKANEITHACVCYSDRASMDELVALCPEIKFYKLQWIADTDQNLDDDIQGIKLHSHRGTGFSFGKESQGLDYNSKEVKQFLKSLPENMIVQYHTQGSASLNNVSRPYMIAKLAVEARHLKHIIVHSGSYGLQSYYPSKVDPSLVITAISQEMLVQEAALVANRLANVYLDSSTLIGNRHYKTETLILNTKKAAMGSDWPYCMKAPYGPILAGERMLTPLIGTEAIQAIHERALHFLDTPVSQLFEEEGMIVNEYAGRSAELKQLCDATAKRKPKRG